MDFAAVRVQLDLRLRAMRAGTEPSAPPEAVALAEQAVDVGSQALILAAAEALGLSAAPVAEAPAEAGTEPSAPPEAVALAEQAVDVGSQALILAAAEALGLSAAPVAEAPAEAPPAPTEPET